MSRRLRRRGLIVVGLLLVVAVAACAGSEADSPLVVDEPDAQSADYDYLIPLGTGQRLDAGETVELLPGRIDATVGEVIRIVNEDERGHLVGAWFVGAGETVTQRFASRGTFTGECTVHPSGQLILEVTE